MPMIDVYAPLGGFSARHELALQLAPSLRSGRGVAGHANTHADVAGFGASAARRNGRATTGGPVDAFGSSGPVSHYR
jgi:hypothetical protein